MRHPQRALINPTSFARKGLPLPGKADPINRSDLLFYSEPKNRGYLAYRAGLLGGAQAQAPVAETGAEEVPAAEPSASA